VPRFRDYREVLERALAGSPQRKVPLGLDEKVVPNALRPSWYWNSLKISLTTREGKRGQMSKLPKQKRLISSRETRASKPDRYRKKVLCFLRTLQDSVPKGSPPVGHSPFPCLRNDQYVTEHGSTRGSILLCARRPRWFALKKWEND